MLLLIKPIAQDVKVSSLFDAKTLLYSIFNGGYFSGDSREGPRPGGWTGTRQNRRSSFAEAGSGAQFGAGRGLGLGARQRLRRRRRSGPDLFRQRLVLQEQLQFHRVEDFAFQQRRRDTLKRVAVVFQNVTRAFVAGSHDAPDFLVDVNRRVFGVVAVLRGIIVTLCSGSVPGVIAATSAWPASWYAVLRFSSSERIIDLRSTPIRTLSLDISKSIIKTSLRLWRAAQSAASFTRLARSAPEKPGVPRAMTERSTSSAKGTFLVCTRRISSRPLMSGRGTTTRRSKRPGRGKAGSSTSGRLVAAIRITPSFDSKPSISTSSALSVCSRSSWPPPNPAPRWRPTASISSMKIMQGAFFLPCSNRSRTRLAPTPTNISTKSEPEIEKNGTLASPAIARASKVFPVPGGPTSKTPFGMRPPSFWNFCGSFRNSMISCSSSLASSVPATSLNVAFFCCAVSSRARDFPKLSALLPPACIWRIRNRQNPTSKISGAALSKIKTQSPLRTSFTLI